MLEAERRRLIATIVQQRSVVAVTELVEMLGASEATVRRDVNAMAEHGQIRRIRGGVESLTPRHEAHLVGMPFELGQAMPVGENRARVRARAAPILVGGGL